jgi:hypothetical protein
MKKERNLMRLVMRRERNLMRCDEVMKEGTCQKRGSDEERNMLQERK